MWNIGYGASIYFLRAFLAGDLRWHYPRVLTFQRIMWNIGYGASIYFLRAFLSGGRAATVPAAAAGRQEGERARALLDRPLGELLRELTVHLRPDRAPAGR